MPNILSIRVFPFYRRVWPRLRRHVWYRFWRHMWRHASVLFAIHHVLIRVVPLNRRIWRQVWHVCIMSACIHISINTYRSVRINALDIVMYACIIHYVYIIASFNACKNANIDICINSCINGYNNACVMYVCILKWFLDVWTRYLNKSAFYRHIWRNA